MHTGNDTIAEQAEVAPEASDGHSGRIGRHHRKAARAVLKALLPESGTDIKGQMRSYSELLEVSGYATRPKDFLALSA